MLTNLPDKRSGGYFVNGMSELEKKINQSKI